MITTSVRYHGMHVAVRHTTEGQPGARCTALTSVITLSPVGTIRPGQDITAMLSIGEQLDLLHRAVERSLS
jgi:hypothetical protein